MFTVDWHVFAALATILNQVQHDNKTWDVSANFIPMKIGSREIRLKTRTGYATYSVAWSRIVIRSTARFVSSCPFDEMPSSNIWMQNGQDTATVSAPVSRN